MPLCISCRGEYWALQKGQASKAQPSAAAKLPWPKDRPEAETPAPPGTPPPAPSSDLAGVYGLQDLPPYVCARCGQSNKRWHEWVTAGGLAHFNRFFLGFWGIQVLVSFILPLVAYVPGVDFTPVASERIGIPLAMLLIFVNVSLLYALKDSLWRYDLMARAGRGLKPPLALLAIIAFALALVFGLAIVFMLEARAAIPGAGPTTGLVRVATTILLAFTFVNVTLSAISMAGHDYGNWLNREMPQPIYAQERRLVRVIEDGLREAIRRATSRKDAVETTIVNLERTPDAGIILMIDAETEFKPEAGQESLRQLQSWRVEADRWGRILKMNREGTPQYAVVKSAPANGAAKAEDGKKSGNGQPALSGEIIFPEKK